MSGAHVCAVDRTHDVIYANPRCLIMMLNSKTQYDGKYRTRSVRVIFDEEIWEKANVRIGDDVVQRLLIYSYFVSAVMIYTYE